MFFRHYTRLVATNRRQSNQENVRNASDGDQAGVRGISFPCVVLGQVSSQTRLLQIMFQHRSRLPKLSLLSAFNVSIFRMVVAKLKLARRLSNFISIFNSVHLMHLIRNIRNIATVVNDVDTKVPEIRSISTLNMQLANYFALPNFL